MRGAALSPHVLEWGGVALLMLGLFVVAWCIASQRDGVLQRQWARYVALLDSKLRCMFAPTNGTTIATWQAVGLTSIVACYAAAKPPGLFLAAALVAVGPPYWIERMRVKRVRAIEAQLDGFVLALANALKATPSLGNAFHSMIDLTPAPLKQDIAYAVNAIRLGTSLDEALLLMASRIRSADVDTVVSALLIGRNVGGNLPAILETTAESLREMSRLEELIRTKTAEGKMQLWVLALFPLFLVVAIASLKPDYFAVLGRSLPGYVLAAVAGLLWVSSLVVARKIMNVDI